MKQPITNIRHTLAHVMAAAVKDIWPNTKFGIGPVIADGFYYDFEMEHKLSTDDFSKIEGKMLKIIKEGVSVEHIYTPIDNAIKNMEIDGQKYKVELLEEIKKGERLATDEEDIAQQKGGKISFYKIGNFIDLCKGPHVKNTAELPADGFKLSHVAGAYWRGNEKNPQLQRIYAHAFSTKKELDEYLKMLEEAIKRDHKKLGPELDLFTFSDLVGSGLPLWTPKGTLLRNLLDDFVWQLRQKVGYTQVDIPHITKKELYERSGHWEKFKDELFKIQTREGHLFAMKPMNCPHHTQIYARKLWSYKELPQRYANTTKCYRDEQTGELAGISRVRAFTQDDAHVFCRMSQAKEEFIKIWDIVHEFYSAFGLELKVRLSKHDPDHPDKYLGDKKLWQKAEKTLQEIVKEKKVDFIDGTGEAAFYGPKLDFLAKDSIGREWQVATIQLDMNMPERFDLNCIDEKGGKERIVMIHAAIMGSIERFLAIVIEHYAGSFPVWLSPVQVIVLPISEKQNEGATKIYEKLKTSGIRTEINSSNGTLGKKIREAEIQKVPYLAVVGEKELSSDAVAVRQRSKGDLGQMKVDEFITRLKEEIEKRI